jgi:putative ABC transport system permease protein
MLKTWYHVVSARLGRLFGMNRQDQDFDQEMQLHLTMLTERFTDQGLSREDAWSAARRQFGNTALLKEDRSRLGKWLLIETLSQDVRFATRSLGKHALLSTAVVATLVFGIGGTVAIFSVVNAVLLRPLRYPEPDRMVQFLTTGSWGSAPAATIPKFKIWREQTDIFQDVAAYDAFFGVPTLSLTGDGKPEPVQAMRVTADYFRLFGARLEYGRSFTAEEDSPNGPQVVVLSSGLWKRRFSADPGMVGKVIRLNGRPHTIVGVMSPEFASDPPAGVWLPFQFDPSSTEHHQMYFTAAGRLRPDVTLSTATARLKLAADRFFHEFPDQAKEERNGGFSAKILQDSVVGDVRPSLYLLSGAVGFVLLIACANVASLLLARAVGRKREIAIRAAVGAGRGRLIRQLLTEGVVLSLLGGTLGLVFGTVAIRILVTLNPGNLPRVGASAADVTPDWRVIAFTAGVSILVGLLVSLAPALEASLIDLNSMLRGGSGLAGTVLSRNRARSLLVIGEVSIAVVLLIGAGLLIRSFITLRSVNLGFESKNVLVFTTSLADSHIRNTGNIGQLVRSGVDRLETLRGVAAAGVAWCAPLDPSCAGAGAKFTIAGKEQTSVAVASGWSSVSPTYFDVLKIPLLRGRSFAIQDDLAAQPVVIVNETLAMRFFPYGDPLGNRLILGTGPNREPARQIVGVVRDTQDVDLRTGTKPTVYVPLSQVSDAAVATRRELVPLAWIVRTKGDAKVLSATIQDALGQASQNLPITSVRTMQDLVFGATASEAFETLLLTIFGGAALVLAAIGVYALAAYSVQNRMQEFGIRMALGADPGHLKRSIILHGLRLIAIGVVLGIAAALGLTRVIAHLLFRVQPADPVVFVSVPLVLGAAALLAIWIPARHAAQIDPLIALRYQ